MRAGWGTAPFLVCSCPCMMLYLEQYYEGHSGQQTSVECAGVLRLGGLPSKRA